MGEPPAEIAQLSEAEAIKELDPVFKFRDEAERRVRETEEPIYVVPHSGPRTGMDFDCLSSAIFYRDILRKNNPGKIIEVLTSDDETNPKSANLSSVMSENKVAWNDGTFEEKLAGAGLVIIVDSNETLARIPSDTAEELKKRGGLMNLDHHAGVITSEDNYIEPSAKATAELLARMYIDEIDTKGAELLAKAILSDTGNLEFIRKAENPRTLEVYNKVRDISGKSDEALISEMPKPDDEGMKKVRESQLKLEISEFPEAKVVIFFEPPEGLDPAKKKEVTDTVLSDVLRSKEADFSIYMRPVVGETGNILFEMKLRSDDIPIAGELADLGHRGGHDRAASMEYWPPADLQAQWHEAQSKGNIEISKAMGAVREAAVLNFIELYSAARQRYEVWMGIAKTKNLTEEQITKLRYMVRKYNTWKESLELRQQYVKANTANIPEFDPDVSDAFLKYTEKVK